MATYKGIKGVKVQSLASDPPAAQSIGQVWYNTASNVLKYSIEGAGAWASSNNTNTAIDLCGYCGTQTAAMYFGGRNSVTTSIATSETYNGSTWTETADLTATVYLNAGFGTTTAAISCGGAPGNTANTFTSNGTSWTAANDMQNSKYNMHGTGTQTAGLIAGGGPSPAESAKTEIYDGTSWTEVNALNTLRWMAPLGGITTAAICIGGTIPPDNGGLIVETYDGTSWTTNPVAINEGRVNAGGSGSTTAALLFAGYGGGVTTEGGTAHTESWNGTAWTEVADLATARTGVGSAQASPNTAALCFGGEAPPVIQSTEEWNDPVYTIKTVTVS